MRSFETLENYLLSLSDAREELLSHAVCAAIADIMRILPTRDFEYNFLADFLMSLNQIMTVATNLGNIRHLEPLVGTLCECLKFNLLPYLYEMGVAGLDKELELQASSRIFFLHQLLEFLNILTQVDTMLKITTRCPSRIQQYVLSS